MALFPRVESHCPYTGDLSAVMDGDTCRLCKRQVFDLTRMDDEARVAFMKSCTGEVCVTYKFPVRPILAAAVVAVAISAPMAAAAADATGETVVVTGGIKDPANVSYVQNPGDYAIPDLPVVYENAGAKQAPASPSKDNTTPVPVAIVSPTAS